MSKRTLRSLLQVLVAGAILLFWGQALVRNGDELARYQWHIEWIWLVAALALLLLQSLLLATLWWYGLRLMGTNSTWRVATAIWLKTQIARYLPGGVWDVAGRVTLSYQAGISVRASSASIALEMTLQVLSASLFLLLLPILRGDVASGAYLPLAVGLVAVCLVAAAPPVFSRLVNLLLRLLRRPALAIEMTYGDVLFMLGARIAAHLMLGVGFVLFARGVSDISWSQAPVMIAAYVGAWLVGYLVVLAPMGIGVRESALTLLLQGLFPLSVIGVLALGYRTWLLVRDLLAALLGVWLGRSPANVAPLPLPPPASTGTPVDHP